MALQGMRSNMTRGAIALGLLMIALGAAKGETRPNIIVIVTDDQDYMLNSTNREFMPQLNRHLADSGLQLRNFLISTAACCPSRSILMTGRYTHNNNVTSNIEPHGSFWKFMSQDLDADYLPVWLQRAGYRTMHVGKFLNAMDPTDSRFRCPRGWSTWDALVEPYVYMYYTPAFSLNCGPTQVLENQYSTDVISDKCDYINARGTCVFPIPAERHRTLFSHAVLPMNPNFNVAPPAELGLVNEMTSDTGVQKHFLARIRALAAVDEMIGRMVNTLTELGVLDNTYILYTSDNGFQLGNHAQKQGKQFHWEEITRVPFYMRGPGIPPGLVTDWQGNMVDIPATVMALTGAGVPSLADGSPIPLPDILPNGFPRPMPIEMWGHAWDRRITLKDYRAIRICTSHLAFGAGQDYIRALPNATLGWGDTFFGTAARAYAGPGLNGGISSYAFAHRLHLAFSYSQPVDAQAWQEHLEATYPTQQDSTCLFLKTALFAASCTPASSAGPGGAWLADDGLAALFSVVLVQGTGTTGPEFESLVLELQTRTETFLGPSYRQLYDIDTLVLPVGLLFYQSVLEQVYVDPAAYLRLISPIACAAVRKVASQAVPAPVQFAVFGVVAPDLPDLPALRAVLEVIRSDPLPYFANSLPVLGLVAVLPAPMDSTRWYTQQDSTCLFLQIAVAAGSCAPRPVALAADGLASSFGVALVQGPFIERQLCMSNFRELYDLVLDPYELNNRISTAPVALIDRLDALMTAAGYCRGGGGCSNPYAVLHPDGSVTSFEQAMDPKYDDLYSKLRKFQFQRCSLSYTPNNEVSWYTPLLKSPPPAKKKQ
eukprot:XP_001702487.1 predicted protein [Chlamydomonas reinhardtii]